ncbi:MAG: RraA family protein [Defluviitaleaceae bacterium]|nr:RraA family protein [Defluviitaleaceae bacterium]
MKESDLIKEIIKYDTPSVTNVVATYPDKPDICLGLYDPWSVNWYTDDSVRCLYPEMGRVAGHAVTCIFGAPSPGSNSLTFLDVLRALDESPRPTVLVIKNGFPEAYKRKCAVCGGNMSTAMVKAGTVGVISDAPTRDVDEVRGMGLQYLVTGATAGHGEFVIKAINVPVSVAGMDVCPGEIIHLDENGAVKFPRVHLAEVASRLKKLQKIEETRMAKMRAAKNVSEVIKILQGFES